MPALTIAASTLAIAQTPSTALQRTESAAPAPGFRPWQSPSTSSKPPLTGGLWLPATGASATDLLFDTAIFQGVSVQTEAAIRHGRWPLDTVLNVILTDAAIGSYVDPLRVFVAGFSLGGWTALSMGGLRGDLNAYANYCAHSGHWHCRDIARAGIDLTQLDASVWNRSYRDPRVRAVAAIDPGLR